MVVNRSLTEPITFAGLPKRFALLLWTVSTSIILGLHQVWFFPLSLALHGLFVAFTKRDPYFFEVFSRAIRHQKTLLP
jgi:type IV secretory pathway TrbD component